MPELLETQAAQVILGLLKCELMREDAYSLFRERFEANPSAQEDSAEEEMRRVDGRLRELQKVHDYLMKAIELGQASPPLIERVNAVDEELKGLRSKRDEVASPPVELPEAVPAIYRSYVDDRVRTLQDDGVPSRASDELHELVESAVVTWRAGAQAHEIELRGKLVEMLKR
jgi:hypothetical protein